MLFIHLCEFVFSNLTMHAVAFLQIADSHLGRVDYTSLSDQTLMELLIEGIEEESKRTYQNDDRTFKNVCEWPRVQCDSEERVVRFKGTPNMKGAIELTHIPPKAESFYLLGFNLKGTLNTQCLPQSLENFSISMNHFDGTVDFVSLPEALVDFNIHKNAFHGSANFKKLPRKLESMTLHSNNFSGEIFLRNLPPNINFLNISENAFTGDFCLQNSPKPLASGLFASYNSFNAIAVVPKGDCVWLTGSDVTSVVDEEGNAHANEREMLREAEYKMF